MDNDVYFVAYAAARAVLRRLQVAAEEELALAKVATTEHERATAEARYDALQTLYLHLTFLLEGRYAPRRAADVEFVLSIDSPG